MPMHNRLVIAHTGKFGEAAVTMVVAARNSRQQVHIEALTCPGLAQQSFAATMPD